MSARFDTKASVLVLVSILAAVIACSPAPAEKAEHAAERPTATPTKPRVVETEEQRHDRIRAAVLSGAREAVAQKDYRKALDILERGAGIGLSYSPWLADDNEVKALLARVKREVRHDDARRRVADAAKGKEGRQEFASKLRQLYLNQGFDIEVHTSGRNAERLMLKYVLFNAVWMNAFEKSDTFFAARVLGFKSVDLDSGYDYHVRVTL